MSPGGFGTPQQSQERKVKINRTSKFMPPCGFRTGSTKTGLQASKRARGWKFPI